jgi:anaerobic C4-dicarboxylate transporter DcuA/anaerobic C4-dicarboxylate transporter DcuB
VDTIGGWVNNWEFIFALAVFLVAALTTSQSTATRTMVPIGLAAGLAPGLVTGMWAGALGGVYVLPTGGPQIAGANFDLSGTTKLGTKLIDHTYFVPNLILSVTTVAVGAAIGVIFF